MSSDEITQVEASTSTAEKEETTPTELSKDLSELLARTIAELEKAGHSKADGKMQTAAGEANPDFAKRASSGGAKMAFEKLKGRENYDEWRVAAKSYLIIKELWKVLEKPWSPEESPEANALAISEITLLIEPSLYSYIKETKSAREVWDGIKKAFADSGTVRKVTIMNQLVSIKLEKIGNMEKYINEILLYWRKSKLAGFKIDEDVIASLLLGGLPEQYRPMILGIENSGKELTVDYIKTVLLQGIKDPIRNRDEDGDEKAMAAKCGFKIRKNANKKGCFICGSFQHIKFQCPKKRKQKKCFNCGQTSHLANQCKLPKKNANEKNEVEVQSDNRESKERVLVAL